MAQPAALVDAAIRRRFAFVELHPDEPPVRDVLTNWLAANDKAGDERALDPRPDQRQERMLHRRRSAARSAVPACSTRD